MVDVCMVVSDDDDGDLSGGEGLCWWRCDWW